MTDADVAEFMSQFARYLVNAGVTSSHFIRIARLAFFQAASESAKFANSRVNKSAVAAMTGLTRAQVRKLASDRKPTLKPRPDHIEKVIKGWNTDSVFTTAGHAPRRLSTNGRRAGFSQLARKYGGDIPSRSILRAMVRNGVVEIKGQYAYLNGDVRQTRSQTQLQQLSQALSQLLKKSNELSEGAVSIASAFQEIAYPSASPKGKALIRREYIDGLSAFMARLQAAGIAASIETPPTSRRKGLITRTRILVLTEEMASKSAAPNIRK